MIEELGKKKVWTQKYPDKGISGVMANQAVWQDWIPTATAMRRLTTTKQKEYVRENELSKVN